MPPCGWWRPACGTGRSPFCPGGLPVEVTTFRREGRYTDHRRPDRVEFTGDLGEDLARRDFTINAMAWEPSGLTDPFGGRARPGGGGHPLRGGAGAPLRRGRPASAACSAVRWPNWTSGWRRGTAAGVRACAPQLACVSRERVAEELKRLVCGPAAGRVLLDCPEVLTRQVLPELAPAVGFDQRNPPPQLRRLHPLCPGSGAGPGGAGAAAGGPAPRRGEAGVLYRGPGGVGHFYGHAAAGAELADACLRRLRLDNALRERVVTLIRRHDLQLEPGARLVKAVAGALGPELFFQWTALAKRTPGPNFQTGLRGQPAGSRWRHWQDRSWPRGPASPCGTWRRTETTPWPGACGGPRWAGAGRPAGRGDGGPSPQPPGRADG